MARRGAGNFRPANRPAEAWAELNDRQRAYLHAIYRLDQEKERDQRGAWNRGERPQKASEWRWIQYTGDTVLRVRLRAAGLVDPGTGATFEALEQRGLIACKYAHETRLFGEPVVVLYVKMTTVGRHVVRAATKEQREAKPPTGMLQEWHWRALALAYASRPNGVSKAGGVDYGRIGWRTWLRLRDYKAGALVTEVETQNITRNSYSHRYTLHITGYGESFYGHWHAYYTARYPDVAAPAPDAAGQGEAACPGYT